MDETSKLETEPDLALRLMEGDDDAYREMIRIYGPKVKGILRAQHPKSVADEAWVNAIGNFWRFSMRYDESQGPLGPWLIAIAKHCAIDIVKRRSCKGCEELPDEYPYAKWEASEGKSLSKKERDRRKRLVSAVQEIMDDMSEQKRTVLKADLAYLSGDVPHDAVAPAETLALDLASTQNNIYKIRHDARQKLRKEMERRGFYQEGQTP